MSVLMTGVPWTAGGAVYACSARSGASGCGAGCKIAGWAEY